MSDTPADQARQGMAATLAGKAKEVVGALLHNDSLAAEGQLQQAEARARRDAATKDAVAEAEAKEAAERLERERAVAEAQLDAVDRVADTQAEQAERAGLDAVVSAHDVADRERAVETSRVEAETAAELRRTQLEGQRALLEADRLEQEARDRSAHERASAEAAEQAAARARADANEL
jgi:uncharacterized protein YjbJ (UPF0337 family)